MALAEFGAALCQTAQGGCHEVMGQIVTHEAWTVGSGAGSQPTQNGPEQARLRMSGCSIECGDARRLPEPTTANPMVRHDVGHGDLRAGESEADE